MEDAHYREAARSLLRKLKLLELKLFQDTEPAFMRLHTNEFMSEKQLASQNPADCSTAKIHVITLKEEGGIGNTMNLASQQLASVVNRHATFMLDRQVNYTGWKWVDDNPWCSFTGPDGRVRKMGFECLWMPLGPCTEYARNYPGAQNVYYFQRLPSKPSRQDGAKALSYLMRPNGRLASWLMKK